VVWQRILPDWVVVMSDDVTPALDGVVRRVSGLPMADQKKEKKDLGETTVVAHTVVAAEAGAEVAVLIDEGAGPSWPAPRNGVGSRMPSGTWDCN
jgi:predicted RecB family endonuclease